MGRYLSYIGLIIIVIIGISFAILNASPITVDYYLGQATMPLSVVIFVSFVLGIMVGLLLMFAKWLGACLTIRRLRKKLNHQTSVNSDE